MSIFVILTSYREESTIGRAVEQLICPNKDLWTNLRLTIVAPDKQTLSKGEEVCQKYTYKNYTLLQDEGKGKAVALNMATGYIRANFKVNQKDVLVFTDGDMYVGDEALRQLLEPFQMAQQKGLAGCLSQPDLGGVGGHPVSLDDRRTLFGYYSHLFCEAAHVKRLRSVGQVCSNSQSGSKGIDQLRNSGHSDLANAMNIAKSLDFIPMSGYLYAVRFIDSLFPIPSDVRAEDAYISQKLVDMGYAIGYAPKALAYVRFPKNFSDWVRQKTRSLGGNVQLPRLMNVRDFEISKTSHSCERKTLLGLNLSKRKAPRGIVQDLFMIFFPLTFAKNPKEFVWSLVLYPLRLFLWFKIYYNHALNRYSDGMWERIESTKR